LLKLIAGLSALALLALGGAALYVDQLARGGIERGGTYALGVDTKVDDVSLAFREGRFGVAGVSVANPPGFESPHFLRVGSARVELPLQRLMDDVVRVGCIEISDVDVTLLRGKQGTNYDAILDNLARFESGKGTGDAPSSSAKQLIIDELLVTNVSARVAVDILAKPTMVDARIPEIRLTAVGAKSAGVTTAELTAILTKAILDAVVRSGGVPVELVKDLRGRLTKLVALDSTLSAGIADAARTLGAGADKGSDVAGNIGSVIEGLLGGRNKE
jgi:hypothetical protein